MKHLTSILLMFMCFALVQETNGQSTENSALLTKKIKRSEYVLEVPRMESQKLLPLFLDKIRPNTTILFKGFCESRNLLFIESGGTEMEEVFKVLDELGLKYFMKEGVGIKTAISSCASKTEVEESLKIDLNPSAGHE